MGKTLMQRNKKKFYPCPHCGKKGVYQLVHYVHLAYNEVRCRYCDASVYIDPKDWRGVDDALAVLAKHGRSTRGQFRTNQESKK